MLDDHKRLDQFYTQDSVSLKCIKHLNKVIQKLSIEKSKLFFIEPSAGSGSFYNKLPKDKKIGLDLEPKHNDIIAHDFLTYNFKKMIPNRINNVVVGNPPFGKRGSLAVDFFNNASEIADTIAFIIPVIFRKYFIHKQLNSDFSWISKIHLKHDSFLLPNGKPYSVNTDFHIWTRKATTYKNKRLFSPPPIDHSDFVMYQYNNTKDALKMFENNFDFAVPSQGWQDYGRREVDKNKCEKNKQWMMFKARSRLVLNRLKGIDYGKLALKNTTSIPGFRKGDVVCHYSKEFSSA